MLVRSTVTSVHIFGIRVLDKNVLLCMYHCQDSFQFSILWRKREMWEYPRSGYPPLPPTPRLKMPGTGRGGRQEGRCEVTLHLVLLLPPASENSFLECLFRNEFRFSRDRRFSYYPLSWCCFHSWQSRRSRRKFSYAHFRRCCLT